MKVIAFLDRSAHPREVGDSGLSDCFRTRCPPAKDTESMLRRRTSAPTCCCRFEPWKVGGFIWTKAASAG